MYTSLDYADAVSVGVTAFNTTGFHIGDENSVSNGNETFASWTFRKASKFFDVQTVVKSAGSNATVDLSVLGTVGMVAVKRTDSTGSWYVFHRSATAGKLLYLEQTAAEATLGHITVSGTTLTLVNGVITDGTYVVYAWAHDADAANGMIQCGTLTYAGSLLSVNLGWETQYVLMKSSDGIGDWIITDVMRGMPLSGTTARLFVNSSNEEISNYLRIYPNATGFTLPATVNINNGTYVYLAIRRPNKPPTSGTQVFNAIARTGTGVAATVTGVGFAPDWWLVR
ncbi:hypothetical protein D4R99_05480, partial [bacterium]